MPDADDLVPLKRRLRRVEIQIRRLNAFAVVVACGAIVSLWPPTVLIVLPVAFVAGPIFLLAWLHERSFPED